MQILPLIQRSSQSAASDAALTGAAGLGSRQSALFASILDSARTTAASPQTKSDPTPASSDASRADVAAAAAEPSDQDLKTLPVTREDIAALRDDLKKQGFSDDEVSALADEAGDGQSMTWGDLMGKVEKKVATTEKSEKKTVSNDDQAQLLGLFGKMGFTTEQSQQMIDSLSKGETQSVWASINTKLDAMSGDESTSLSASELTSLGRAMNLSEDAQSRLASMVNQSGAEAGLTGQGIVTAMALVKNELTAQIGKENQALSEFRQASSGVLANAWQRETGKRNSDLHQDDVARKAGQIVAMSNEQSGNSSSAGLDALADVPLAGQGLADATTPGSSETAQTAQTAQTGQTVNARTAQTAAATGVTAELAGKAGPVAAEQAALAGENGVAPTQQTAQPEVARPATDKTAVTVASAAAGNETQNFFGGQQGAAGGNLFGQENQDSALAEFMNKVRVGKVGTTQAGQTADVAATTAAMDAVKTTSTNPQAKIFDPALAARVAKQVETGILKGVSQEAKQLTVNLTPDELGPVQVTLSVKDKEVRAVIAADNADTAALLQEHAAKIKQQLEDQGFTVAKLDVQTGLAQDNQTAAWDSPERHNEAREQREAMERVRSAARLAREAVGFDADSLSAIPGAMTARAAGLDLFA